jgi:hypothetical protein
MPNRVAMRVDLELTYCVMQERDIQTTVAVNGTVRMVPRISNAIDLATCPKSSDLRLDMFWAASRHLP